MSTEAINTAIGRLSKAVDQLESALEQRRTVDGSIKRLEEEVVRLGNDRNRLAQTLDDAEARSARLEGANKEVSRRLVSAMESIRAVLEANGA